MPNKTSEPLAKPSLNEVEPLLFKVNDAAKMLSRSRSGLYDLAAAGKVRLVRIGCRSYVPREELLRLAGANVEAAE